MSSLGSRLADCVSLLPPADERDVVRGDLTESGEGGAASGGRVEELAAMVRAADGDRQKAEAGAAIGAADPYKRSVNAWIYLANWRMADTGNSGFRRLLLPGKREKSCCPASGS